MSTINFKKLPPLHALAAFEAVARLESFARAADELCITHGAVSHRIKTLERHFGVRFFSRRGGKTTLTNKGTYLLSAVLDAFSTLQEASKRIADTRRVVTISAGPSTAHNWLIPRLNGFYREHPGIDLEITMTKLVPSKQQASLESGEADVVIRYGRKENWTGFRSAKLMDVALFPVCSPAYLEKMGDLHTPAALQDGQWLRLPHEPWKPWFEASGFSRDEPASGPLFSDASLILDAASNSQGVALARDVLVERDIVSGRLVRLWRASVPSTCAYFVVWSAHEVRTEVHTFIEWLGTCGRLCSAAHPAPAGEEWTRRLTMLDPLPTR